MKKLLMMATLSFTTFFNAAEATNNNAEPGAVGESAEKEAFLKDYNLVKTALEKLTAQAYPEFDTPDAKIKQEPTISRVAFGLRIISKLNPEIYQAFVDAFSDQAGLEKAGEIYESASDEGKQKTRLLFKLLCPELFEPEAAASKK